MKNCEILVISLSSPLLFGIYENGKLTKALQSNAPSSDALIELLDYANKNYKITKIIYANGPGSFMGLKVSYATLKVFCDTLECDFLAFSAFEIADKISAKKGFCFVRNNGEIVLEKCEPDELKLPDNLADLNLSFDTLPHYVLDAL